MTTERKAEPVSFWQAVTIFGTPGVAIYLAVHHLVPVMVTRGVPLVFAWTLAVVGPTVLNALVVVGFYLHREQPTFEQFTTRFRLATPSRHLLWQAPLAALSIVVLNESLAWTVPHLSKLPLLAPPEIVPEIFADVYESLGSRTADATFMGEALSPQKVWLVPFWLFFWVTLGVLGEELVWRGYVLPGQEVLYGKYAWLLNGLLWNVPFHLYTIHNFFSDMPLYLLLPLLVQRTGNTWFGIAVHALLVALALVLLLPGVAT